MYTYRENVGNGSVCVETTKALSTKADIRMMTDSTGATANGKYISSNNNDFYLFHPPSFPQLLLIILQLIRL